MEGDLGSAGEWQRQAVAGLAARDAELVRSNGLGAHWQAEIVALRADLERERARGGEQLRSIAAIGAELHQMRANALGQATRIRLQALREAAAVSRIAGHAAGSTAAGERLAAALEAALDRIAADWDDVEAEAEGEIKARRVSFDPALSYEDRVSFDVGPFEDFSQLVSFEDAANAIGATGDISIKRFSEGRARIDVSLSEPVDILRELEERCDLQFQVRSRRDGEIVLDFGE